MLKEGADFTIKNGEDMLPIDLAPDKEVKYPSSTRRCPKVLFYLTNFHRRCAAI